MPLFRIAAGKHFVPAASADAGTYKSVHLELGYRLDIVVEEKLVVELKTVERLMPVHEAQLLSYLKLGGFRIGLLVNFNVPVLKEGLKRLVV